jgi:hypothetical protein
MRNPIICLDTVDQFCKPIANLTREMSALPKIADEIYCNIEISLSKTHWGQCCQASHATFTTRENNKTLSAQQ